MNLNGRSSKTCGGEFLLVKGESVETSQDCAPISTVVERFLQEACVCGSGK